MPKAFLARGRCKRPRGIRGHAPPEIFLKQMLPEWLKMHPNIADTVNYFIIYQANKHQN